MTVLPTVPKWSKRLISCVPTLQSHAGHPFKKKKNHSRFDCWLTTTLTFFLPRLHPAGWSPRKATLDFIMCLPCSSPAAELLRLPECRPLLLTSTLALISFCGHTCYSLIPTACKDSGHTSVLPSVNHHSSCRGVNRNPRGAPQILFLIFLSVLIWKGNKSSQGFIFLPS